MATDNYFTGYHKVDFRLLLLVVHFRVVPCHRAGVVAGANRLTHQASFAVRPGSSKCLPLRAARKIFAATLRLGAPASDLFLVPRKLAVAAEGVAVGPVSMKDGQHQYPDPVIDKFGAQARNHAVRAWR